jgi:3-hydroxyisobutyrate dehydrogenase-like beta-hydroxyacid dehydrogenase
VGEIGIIGLGLLGSALAHRFLASGRAVVGYDIDARRRAELEAAGGQAAVSALDVPRGRQVLVLSLPDADVVAAVVGSLEPALHAGHLIIDTSTSEPGRSAALGESLTRRGIRFLDATVAGSSVQVREGQAIVMAGGEAATFEAARETLACFSKAAFHVGPWGSGARMKLVVNLVLGLNRAALAEGLTLAAALELAPRAALEILKASPAYSTVMDAKGEKMLARDYEPQARLSQHLKDVRLMLDAAARTGTPLPLSELHRELLERAERAGLGELDNSAVLEVFRLLKKPNELAEGA